MTLSAYEYQEGRGRRLAERRRQGLAFSDNDRRIGHHDRRMLSLTSLREGQSYRAGRAGQYLESLDHAVIQKWQAVATAAPLATDDNTALQHLVRGGVWSLARYCGMSRRTLRRRCAKAGVRLADYRHALRREYVRQLLSSQLSLSEIASRLGFASSQTLARFVKKELGATATSLRQRV